MCGINFGINPMCQALNQAPNHSDERWSVYPQGSTDNQGKQTHYNQNWTVLKNAALLPRTSRWIGVGQARERGRDTPAPGEWKSWSGWMAKAWLCSGLADISFPIEHGGKECWHPEGIPHLWCDTDCHSLTHSTTLLSTFCDQELGPAQRPPRWAWHGLNPSETHNLVGEGDRKATTHYSMKWMQPDQRSGTTGAVTADSEPRILRRSQLRCTLKMDGSAGNGQRQGGRWRGPLWGCLVSANPIGKPPSDQNST